MGTLVHKLLKSWFGLIICLFIILPIGVHMTNPLTGKKDKPVAKPVIEKKTTTNVTKTIK